MNAESFLILLAVIGGIVGIISGAKSLSKSEKTSKSLLRWPIRLIGLAGMIFGASGLLYWIPEMLQFGSRSDVYPIQVGMFGGVFFIGVLIFKGTFDK